MKNIVSGTKSYFIKHLWKICVLFTYIVLLAITIIRHEPWCDEAQAWLLARDSSLSELFLTHLRYEGSPGLWHLILFIPAKLGMPFITMNIIAGIVATFGVAIFLWKAPFTKLIKILLPFSNLIIFQYAAVGRQYVLLPCLFFLLATIFPTRKERPFRFLTILILISMTSLHGTVAVFGIYAAHCMDLLIHWKNCTTIERRNTILTFVIYVIVHIFMVYVLWVPKDYYNINNIIHQTPLDYLPNAFLILGDVLMSNIFCKRQVNIIEVFLLVSSLITWYLTFKFVKRKKFIKYLAFPLVGLISFFSLSFLSPWHTGILFLLWLFSLWISFEKNLTWILTKGEQKVLMVMIIMVLVLHGFWGLNTIWFDWRYSYSGGPKVAEYIKKNHLEDKVYTKSNFIQSVLVYFNHNIIADASDPTRSFMHWNREETLYTLSLYRIYKEQPELIIIRTNVHRGNYRMDDILNYEFVGIFNGGVYWRYYCQQTETYILYRKKPGTSLNKKPSQQELDKSLEIFKMNRESAPLIPHRGPIIGSW